MVVHNARKKQNTLTNEFLTDSRGKGSFILVKRYIYKKILNVCSIFKFKLFQLKKILQIIPNKYFQYGIITLFVWYVGCVLKNSSRVNTRDIKVWEF